MAEVAPAVAPASDVAATKAANRALQKSVLHTLSKTKGLRVSNITIVARSGVVTLEGSVPEESQVELATRAAQSVPGVTEVKNALILSVF